MFVLLISLLLLATSSFTEGFTKCGPRGSWTNVKGFVDGAHSIECMMTIKDQIEREMQASMAYLLMSSHYDRDSVNLRNFASMYSEMADEERDHSKMLIDYARFRGDISLLSARTLKPENLTLTSGEHSLHAALKLEKEFTKHIHEITKVCDSGDDFHAADWLTTQLLDEQLKGVRHLAGLVNELQVLKAKNQALGEWIFDQQLGKK